MKKDIDVNEQNAISEDDLEDVAGGGLTTANDENCYFEPTSPRNIETRNGEVWAECSKRCFASGNPVTGKGARYCSCHGTSRCINRMHIMEFVFARLHAPAPRNLHNHSEIGKSIHV